MNDALVKILPKMKKFDAYINDVKKDNFPISLSGLSDSQKVHFIYSTRFYTERLFLSFHNLIFVLYIIYLYYIIYKYCLLHVLLILFLLLYNIPKGKSYYSK